VEAAKFFQKDGRPVVNLVRSEIGQAAASATVEPIEGKTK